MSEPAPASPTTPTAPRATSVGQLVLVGVAGVLLGLSPFLHGGYSAGVWAPAGFVVAALLVALLVMGARRPTPSALLAVAALTGLGLLTVVSGSWSPTPALASEHGQRLLVIAGLFGILVTLVQDRRSAAVALGGAIGGVTIVALWTLLQLLGGSGDDLFLGGRLNEPLGYVNGQGSIYVLAFGACLAATGARSPLQAGAGAGLAVLFADLALLSQSRGVLITLMLASVVVVLSARGRIRRAVGAVVVGAAVLIAAPTLLDVLGQATYRGLPAEAVQPAGRITLTSAFLATLVWGGLVAVVGSLGDDTTRRTLRSLAGIAIGAVAMGGVIIAVANAGTISDRVRDQLAAFVQVEVRADADGTRLLSGAGTRYDYWRIAAGEFADHPVAGVGAGGFVVAYFRERQTDENILQAHSVFFQTLSDLGLLGLVLLALFYLGLARGLIATARRAGDHDLDRVLAAASFGMAASWVVHSNIDWILLLPGVTGVACIGLAVGLRPAEDAPPPGPLARPAAIGLGVLAAAIAAWTTAGLVSRLEVRHDIERARAAQREDPARAIRLTDRAIERDPTALEAYYVKAAAQARTGAVEPTVETLRQAIVEQPTSFVSWGLLADVLSRAGETDAALAAYRRALRLNPRDAGLRDALRSTRAER